MHKIILTSFLAFVSPVWALADCVPDWDDAGEYPPGTPRCGEETTQNTQTEQTQQPSGQPAATPGTGYKSRYRIPHGLAERRHKSPSKIKAEVEKELTDCRLAADKAAGWCALNSPQVQALLDFGTLMGSATAGRNQKSICERAKTVSSISAGVNGGIAAACEQAAGGAHIGSVGYTGCTSICEKLVKDKESEMNGNTALLDDLADRIDAIEGDTKEKDDLYSRYIEHEHLLEVNNRVATEAKRYYGQCFQYRTTSIAPMLKAAALATKAATDPSCDQYEVSNDLNSFCSKAENKGSNVCLAAASCSDPIRARQDPLCNGGGGSGGPGGTGIGGIGGGINKPALGGGKNPLDDFKKLDGKVGADGQGTRTQNEGIAGGGGGGPTSPNANNLNPEEGGGQAPDYKTEIEQGYQRSRGMGEGSMFAGRSGGGYLEQNGAGGKRPGLDLTKYMPWMKKAGPDRQIAEINKLKADGVTGANGPSIWDKVSNRMRALRGRLE